MESGNFFFFLTLIFLIFRKKSKSEFESKNVLDFFWQTSKNKKTKNKKNKKRRQIEKEKEEEEKLKSTEIGPTFEKVQTFEFFIVSSMWYETKK